MCLTIPQEITQRRDLPNVFSPSTLIYDEEKRLGLQKMKIRDMNS